MTNPKKVSCKNCKTPIYRSTGRFNENLKFGWNFYCSRKCEYQYKTKKQILMCENCGKVFGRTPCAISPHNYCSQSCAAIVNNKKCLKGHAKIKPKLKTYTECGKQYKKNTNNIKYCSLSCRRKAEQKTPEELINIIKETAKKLKRAPARRELKRINDPCRKVFGSWNKAVAAAGLKPNRSHENRMYKRIITKATDGHPCDSISELLIDNWFIKNKIGHERNVSYPNTNHKADWGINFQGKTIFVEYFGLAKDSSRYDRSIAKKKTLCSKHKIKLIEVYPWDLYPEKNLDIKLKIFLS